MHGEATAMAARRGRKRKQGHRKPSGDLIQSQPKEPQESAQVIAWQHPNRRTAPYSHADDVRAETPLGILNIIGAVSNIEFGAARRFARIVRKYHQQVINSPNPSPPSLLGTMVKSEPWPEDHEARRSYNDSEDDPATIKADYDAVFEYLNNTETGPGRTSISSLNAMACYGEPCPVGTFPAMMRGLRALTVYFDLTDRAKSALVGNTR